MEDIEENSFVEENTEELNILYQHTSLNIYNQNQTILYQLDPAE